MGYYQVPYAPGQPLLGRIGRPLVLFICQLEHVPGDVEVVGGALTLQVDGGPVQKLVDDGPGSSPPGKPGPESPASPTAFLWSCLVPLL